jgi:thiol-disulfide isomerase/thioredoxin
LAGKPLRLSGPGLSGGTVDIAQYKGRVVLVFCWATWCTPCTEDLPQLRALYAQYRERGFEVVSVNLDTTSERVAPFLSQNRVTWPQIFQPGGLNSAIAQEFGIVSLPTLFLVDQQGTVITSNTSVDDLKTRLAELFKK